MHKKVKKENPIIAYKGFDEDLSCRDFMYEVGKEYHIDGDIEVCKKGFHACQNPLDVFDHYNMSSYTRYAMVELWGDVDFSEIGNKLCASDIRIVKEISIDELVEIGIMSSLPKKDLESGNERSYSMMIASDACADIIYPKYEGASIASCGNYASINSKNRWQCIASSGKLAKIDAFCDYSNISSSGINARITSVGLIQNISTSGYGSLVISHGHDVNVASADMAMIYSDGENADLYASGAESKIASRGDNANICIDSMYGYINSSGDNTRIMSAENLSTIESTGEKAVIMSAGHNTRARAKIGSWIVLTEYDNNREVKCIKAEYVDGERIKGDTLYRLVNGEFVKTI